MGNGRKARLPRPIHRLTEPPVLQICEFLVRFRYAEMGKDALHLHHGACPPGIQHFLQSGLFPHADAGHAGVDFQMSPGPPPQPNRRRLQIPQHAGAEHRRRRVGQHRFLQGIPIRSPQNQHRAIHSFPAQSRGLVHNGHRQPPRAPLQEGPPRLSQAVAVCVRLHHRHHPHLFRQRGAKGSGVVLQRPGRNLQRGLSHSESTCSWLSIRMPFSAKSFAPFSGSSNLKIRSASTPVLRTKE